MRFRIINSVRSSRPVIIYEYLIGDCSCQSIAFVVAVFPSIGPILQYVLYDQDTLQVILKIKDISETAGSNKLKLGVQVGLTTVCKKY